MNSQDKPANRSVGSDAKAGVITRKIAPYKQNTSQMGSQTSSDKFYDGMKNTQTNESIHETFDFQNIIGGATIENNDKQTMELKDGRNVTMLSPEGN